MATKKATGKSEEFDDDLFETRLESLKDTQESVQQMSSWCLQRRGQHKKIVTCWLNVLKRVRVEHRLVLFYLANDVIQYSKRKHYEFVESWATALQRATTMVRDEKVKGKILRIFNIWEQREIYSEEYISDLNGLLNINTPKKSQPIAEASDDYQNGTLVANVRECVELSTATDKSFKKLPKAPNCDIDNIKQQLKDKSHSEDVEKELERYVTYIEAYNKNLQMEIKSRHTVLANLDTAIKFYASQRGEVKVVVSAYKNFGSRIKLVKKKLDEITPNLPSPIPSPDINAPSPEPDTDLQLPDEESPISINLFKSNMNGYTSYLDGNLPFDINDFKSDTGPTKTSSQPIEVIGSRSDDESFNSSVEYYKPESISTYSNNSNVSIPGLNPMPVPPVQSEYTSLARSAQQYSGILPPPNPPLFGYSSLMAGGYSRGENSYHNNGGDNNSSYDRNGNAGGRGNNMEPLMPPPPMPPIGAGGGGGGGPKNNSEDFNSTWDLNMSWTSMDSSNASHALVDTPVSPPHFERKSHNENADTIEYSENSLLATEDVDHRQLHLPPAFNIGVKLGLSKEKTRQLDIDHRNLISLTGSPGTNDHEKHSWLSSQDENFRTNQSGDVDYRTGLGQAIQTIDTIPVPSSASLESPSLSSSEATSPTGLMAPPLSSSSKKSNSPQKSNASSSSESKEEGNTVGTRYDPTDMVVDMDMSDEDLDDIFREVNEQNDEPIENSQESTASDEHQQQQQQTPSHPNANADEQPAIRPALLETPPEYVPQNIWDPAGSQMNMSGGYPGQNMGMEMQQHQHHPQEWNQMPQPQMQWNGGGARGGCAPPPPRPPFPLSPFQYQGGADYGGGAEYGGGNMPEYGGGAEYGGEYSGRGRGRGWGHSPQNQFRNFSRPPRGSPYFSRGGRGRGGDNGGGMRGSFRGRFRGNNSWT